MGNDEKLIDLVREFPAIYDPSDSRFDDRSLKIKIWRCIGKEMNSSGPVCRFKWHQILESYSNSYKSRQPEPETDLARKLYFINEHIDAHPAHFPPPPPSADDDVPDIYRESSPDDVKSVRNADSIDDFLSIIGPILRNLSNKHLQKAAMEDVVGVLKKYGGNFAEYKASIKSSSNHVMLEGIFYRIVALMMNNRFKSIRIRKDGESIGVEEVDSTH